MPVVAPPKLPEPPRRHHPEQPRMLPLPDGLNDGDVQFLAKLAEILARKNRERVEARRRHD